MQQLVYYNQRISWKMWFWPVLPSWAVYEHWLVNFKRWGNIITCNDLCFFGGSEESELLENHVVYNIPSISKKMLCLQTKPIWCSSLGELHMFPMPNARWETLSVDFIVEVAVTDSWQLDMLWLVSLSQEIMSKNH